MHVWSYLTHFFPEWEMFQTKFAEKIKPHILCSITFFEKRSVYKMCKNMVEPNWPQMTIWGMPIACWIPKATDTFSEYVILIAFLTRLNVIRTLLVLLFTKCMGTDPHTLPFLPMPERRSRYPVRHRQGRCIPNSTLEK